MKGFFSFLICIIAIGTIGFLGYWAATTYVAAQDTVGVAHQAFDLINQERERLNRPPLIWSDALAEKAIEYSQQMNDTNIFEHSNMPYAENILDGGDVFSNGEQVYNPWDRSPGHYTNMVNPSYHYGAIGIYDNYATFLAY